MTPHSLAPPYDFSPPARLLLQEAGWYPGRVIERPLYISPLLDYPPAVLAMLREFGGLTVPIGDKELAFEPTAAEWEDKIGGALKKYSWLLGRTLYPIGLITDETDQMDVGVNVGVDKYGAVYLMGRGLERRGQTFAEGISNLLTDIQGEYLHGSDLTWE